MILKIKGGQLIDHSEGDWVLENLMTRYIRPDTRILEVGCGTGESLVRFCEQFHCTGTGIDPFISARMNQNPDFLPLRAENINNLNETFDLIYSIRAFHHIGNPKLFASVLPAVLKHDGIFILTDWKNGHRTGIPEHYYSLSETKSYFQQVLTIIESEELETVFYLIAQNKK